jgi:cytochrome c oxidase cbb3-type subunit 3
MQRGPFSGSVPVSRWLLGPFLKAGHPTQSGKPASFTNDEVIALATFLRQRVTDTMRWSTVFVPGNILVGDSRAGEAYFNGRGSRHSPGGVRAQRLNCDCTQPI